MQSERLSFALEAAKAGAASTLELFHKGAEFELKSDDSPVTAADRRAEEIIREMIEQRFPGETVLGEEQGLEGSSSDRWVIDPIDGTKSFVAGVPLYATLLSWEESGQPIVAVTILPALNQVFYAELGKGAFLNGEPTKVKDQPIEQAVICTGSLGNLSDRRILEPLTEISNEALAMRTWGDAHGHMLVASGRAQAMIDPIINHWDISAPSLIVREAGGRSTTLDGSAELGADHISATPEMHRYILERFEK